MTQRSGCSALSGSRAVLFTTLVAGCAGERSRDPFGSGADAGSAVATESASVSDTGSASSSPDSGLPSSSDDGTTSASEGATTPESDGQGTAPGNDEGTSGEQDATGSGPKFDLASNGTSPGATGGTACQGDGGEGEGGDCTEEAPPNSFEADIQWTWEAPDERESAVAPLVGNFTDDNGDGKIGPCDIPDLVVVATSNFAASTPGHIYVLDGGTGALHFKTSDMVDPTVTPAIADIDGDGLLEIVTTVSGGITTDDLIVFEHDGTKKFVGPAPYDTYGDAIYAAIALADLDNDGDVEIIIAGNVYDHTGKILWTAAAFVPSGTFPSATAAADLDGDGDLEVVLGHAAYHHDGSQYYLTQGVNAGFPQIANLDGDPEPEVLITNEFGLTMLEHTGAVKYEDLRPTGDSAGANTWVRPATVHDFDGNGTSEFAMSSANNYTVYNGNATIVWKAAVSDQSGVAAGTAFDFLGDGKAEAMYADEFNFHIFNDVGLPYFSVPRSSRTIIEYPVVADLDNDGSAEIAVVSMGGGNLVQTAPTVQVIRDKQDRWVQARRIWNQHTYHVTNVNEDGTIPQFEAPNWNTLNTFRTQAQIHSGGVCKPPLPEG